MRSISSSVIVSAVRSYSFVVFGDEWSAIRCACSSVRPVRLERAAVLDEPTVERVRRLILGLEPGSVGGVEGRSGPPVDWGFASASGPGTAVVDTHAGGARSWPRSGAAAATTSAGRVRPEPTKTPFVADTRGQRAV